MESSFAQEICIDGKLIGPGRPTYFIADIASNHDGSLERAKELIHLAAQAGADAAKFQHFRAETIVSDYGFKQLNGQLSHQATWSKSVFEIYQDYSLNPNWTSELKETCNKAGIAFLTSPYSKELVDFVDPYVSAYKIGSGDITWHEIICHIGRQGKPVILSTGAATMEEVSLAVKVLLSENNQVVLMQCNTNYTANRENLKYTNLNVLNTYRERFAGVILGLSDHTPGDITIIGAIAMGARVVEKHFTDDTNRDGPDHQFSMTPQTWKDMVERSRELESAFGDGIKKYEENEKDSAVIQKRALRFTKDLEKGHTLEKQDVFPLRPIPTGGLAPYKITEVLGRSLIKNVVAGDCLRMEDIE